MSLKIYNTLTRKKETFEPIEPDKVRMYVCGPTVYDSAHVGHAMSTIVFDVIRRYLEFKGYEVSHVMNYTDVDDKVIRRAIELGVDAVQLAARYIAEYDRHLEELNTLIPMITPRVSQEIAGIINMVEGLVDGGYAYEVDGDVYFRVARDPDYGKLSGRKLEDMRAGFRLEVDERKEDAADFALWKASKPGEPSWESPWGPGRPGWHIECSAMAYRHLGEEIDIHGGGNDLIFPHHENEIAQSESLTEKPFARYWMHNGMLQIGGEDMSKSLGNMVTVDEFLADHPSDALRLMVLNASYRAPLIFTEEVVEQAEKGLDRLMGALRPGVAGGDVDPEVTNALERNVVEVRNGFVDSMDDDFNTAGALAQLFDLVRSINQSRDAGVADAALQSAQAILKELAGVLGLRLERDDTVSSDATPFIDLLVSVRDELREAKEWALADMIRDKLEELGVLLEDEKSGTSWRHR